MRSRDVRPFTVEFKTKRRPAAALPPSIWGSAAILLKTAPEPRTPPLVRGADTPILRAPSIEVAPESNHHPRRVLPDLRMAEAVVLDTDRPIRVTRRSRKGVRGMMQENVEKRGELQIETAAAQEKPVEHRRAEAESEDALWEASAPSREITQVPQPVEANTPLVVPQGMMPRSRRWTRRVEDLPRGERWRRRLPDVCR